jgi:hypothetical protein
MNEEKALLVSSIPNRIWKKYKLSLSKSGEFLWIGKSVNVSILTQSLMFVHFFDSHICLSSKGSFVNLYFKFNSTQVFIY